MKTFVLVLLMVIVQACPVGAAEDESQGHVYFAAYGGLAFPESLANVEGRQALQGTTFSDLSLNRSGLIGLKLGLAPPKRQTWINWELEMFYASPHVKQQTLKSTTGGSSTTQDFGGNHVRNLVTAWNFILRYPEGPIQPYLGLGPSLVWFRVDGRDLKGSDTSLGFNLIAGTRLEITKHVFAFTEYKHNRSRMESGDLGFDLRFHALAAGLGLTF